MAIEKQEKKRKVAASSSAASGPTEQPSKKSKKAKKSETSNSTGTKPAKGIIKNGPALKAASETLDDKPARKVKPRKRAADFLSDEEDDDHEKTPKKQSAASADATKPAENSPKPAKKKAKKAAQQAQELENGTATGDYEKKNKGGVNAAAGESKGKKAKAISKQAHQNEDISSDSENEGSADEADDQTDALIKGFESSGEEDISGDEGFEPGQEVPTIPDSKQVKRKMQKLKKRGQELAEPQQPGTVYISRIPHGFYEHEMRAYFSQFGTITNLRLSRNRITGRSKHYAFIEFSSASVARIVAETMNNYLMFGHILKCSVIPQDKLHPAIWKGANRRFKRTPWNRIEKRRMEAGKTRDAWSKKIEQEEKKRKAKAAKMEAIGYEMEVPKLKGVDEIPVRGEEPTQVDDESEKVKTIEEPTKEVEVAAAESDNETPKKNTKKQKQKQEKKSAVSDVSEKGVNDTKEAAVNKAEQKKKSTKEEKKSKDKSKASPAAAVTTPEKAAQEKAVTEEKRKDSHGESPATKGKVKEKKQGKKSGTGSKKSAKA